jgi:hypothetical protein
MNYLLCEGRASRPINVVLQILLMDLLFVSSSWGSSFSNVSGIVDVPCGVDSTYGPHVGLGTIIVLQNCDTHLNGTRVTIRLDRFSKSLLGLSIVIKNSRRVSVFVSPVTSRSCNLSNVSVWIQNITNDMDNDSLLVNASVFRIAEFSSVSDCNITVLDVLHTRDTAFLRVNYVDAVERLAVTISNVFFASTYAVMAFDTVTTSIRNSIVVLVNVTKYFGAGLYSVDSLVNLDSVVVQRTNISLIRCRIIGSVSTATTRNLASVRIGRASRLEDHSTVTIFSLEVRVDQASAVGAMMITSSTLSNVGVSIVNFTILSPHVTCFAFFASDATLQHSSLVARDTSIVDIAAPSFIIFQITSSSVSSNTIAAEQISLSTKAEVTGSRLVMIYMEGLQEVANTTALIVQCTLTSQTASALQVLNSRLTGTDITISGSSLTATNVVVILIVNVSFTNTRMLVDNVTTSATSQYYPILISNVPAPSTGVRLLVLNSYIAGAFHYKSLRVRRGCLLLRFPLHLSSTAVSPSPTRAPPLCLEVCLER